MSQQELISYNSLHLLLTRVAVVSKKFSSDKFHIKSLKIISAKKQINSSIQRHFVAIDKLMYGMTDFE